MTQPWHDEKPGAAGRQAPDVRPAERDPTAALADYEINHLGEHLAALGDSRALDKVLRLEWAEHVPVTQPLPGLLARLFSKPAASTYVQLPHPAWFEAKNRVNRPAGFIEDVQRAWRLVTEEDSAECAHSGTAAGIGRQVRYALLLASVNSYASAVPDPLLVALVRGEVWTAPQAVAYARRIPEAEDRLAAMSALLPAMAEPLRSQVAVDAFAAARQLRAEGGPRSIISSEEPQLSLPGELVACLPEAQVRQALNEVGENRRVLLLRLAELGHLDDARRLANGKLADCHALAPYMAETAVRRLLADASDAAGPYLTPLYLRLAAFGHVDEALRYARTLEFPGSREDVLLGIAPYVPRPVADRAKSIARELLRPGGMVVFLAAMARAAAGSDRVALLDEALALLPDISEYSADELLTKLIPQLDQRQLDRAAALVHKTRGHSGPRLQVLFAIAGASTGERRARVLKSALKPAGGDALANVRRLLSAGWAAVDPHAALQASIEVGCVTTEIANLAPYLPASLLTRALSAVARLSDPGWQVLRFAQQGAVAFAELRPGGDLSRVASLGDPMERAKSIVDLAATLPEPELAAALDIARGIPGGDYRVPALEALAPRLSGNLLDLALDACHGEYERHWAQALGSFAPYLGDDKLLAAVTEAEHLTDPGWRARAYSGLAAYLPPLGLRKVERLTGALAADVSARADVLAKLAVGFAAQGEYQHALDLVRDIRPRSVPSPGLEAIIAMADTLPAEMTGAALDILGEERWNPALAPLARRLDAQRRRSWREAAMQHADPGSLANLAVWLGEPDPGAALDQAEELGAAEAIPILAPILPPDLIRRALELARSRPDREAPERTRALLALAAHAQPEAAEPLLEESLRSALDIEPYRDIGTDVFRTAEIWRALRAQLISLPSSRQYPMLVRALDELSQRGRADCLTYLGELMQLVGGIGGGAAIEDSLAAAADVARWWP